MGENETDKLDTDNQAQPVEEETDTSKNDRAEDDTEEGADSDDNNDDDSDDEEETDDDEDDTDDKKSKKSTSKDKDDTDEEPPVRKRPSDFARERIERKNANKDKSKDDANDDTEDDEDDDIDPADKKNFSKIVEKAIKPFVEKQMKEEDDKEVSTFLKDNPDFAPYEAKARKYMSHPSRKDVPISEIFYGVAGKDLLKIGAKRAKIADQEAKKSKGSGGADDAGGVKSAKDMSKAELEAKQQEVRAKLADRY